MACTLTREQVAVDAVDVDEVDLEGESFRSSAFLGDFVEEVEKSLMRQEAPTKVAPRRQVNEERIRHRYGYD